MRSPHPRLARVLATVLATGVVLSAGLTATASAAPSSGDREAAAHARSAVDRPHKPRRKPAVTKVSPSSGLVTGGTRVTISGRNFTRVLRVSLGGQPFKNVVVRSKTRIVATTPAGLTGTYPVSVRTKKGTSRPAKPARFRYRDPQPTDATTIQTLPTTVTGDGVEWVTGGSDLDDPSRTDPWVVGIGPDGTVPEVGDGYYVAPGGEAFPSGLAGTVTEISSQAAGVTAVTVAPTSFGDVLGRMDVSYADGAPAGARSKRDVTDASLTFEGLSPSAFRCKNDDGENIAFKGALGLHLENISKSFDLMKPGVGFGGYVSAWVRYDVVLSGHVTAEAQMKCGLSDAWVNAHRKVIPIGTTGATVSIGPKAEFTVSGSGTVKFTQRNRRMVGYTYNQGDVQPIDVRKDLGMEVTGGELAFQVTAEAGVSVQFGLLDRAGIELSVTLALDGKVTVSGPPAKACVDASVGVKIKINAFLDVWVTRWESPGYEHTWAFASYNKCSAPAAPAGDTSQDPVITSLRLGGATSGSYYDDRLTTADDRGGQWSIVDGALPDGLTLDGSNGEVFGTPSGHVGDYLVQVRFTDSSNRSATSPVRIYLSPPTPVNGGAVQATLTWGSVADLDLHVVDPAGTHIYYGNRSSDSGGELDRDANAACDEALTSPIENVYWDDTAPSGTYTVYVNEYDSCAASDVSWHLVVRVGGRVVLDETGTGSSPDYSFTLGGGQVTTGQGHPQSGRDAHLPAKASS